MTFSKDRSVLPWPTVPLCRGDVDWSKLDRERRAFFDAVRVQHQINYYDDLAWMDKSWLTKKFLTFAAWARTLLKR